MLEQRLHLAPGSNAENVTTSPVKDRRAVDLAPGAREPTLGESYSLERASGLPELMYKPNNGHILRSPKACTSMTGSRSQAWRDEISPDPVVEGGLVNADDSAHIGGIETLDHLASCHPASLNQSLN